MTRNEKPSRLTIEKLVPDCHDVRELQRAGLSKNRRTTLRPSLRWPKIVSMKADKYLIRLDLLNQTVPQYVRVTWTGCFYGGARAWVLCPHCRKRVARLFKGMGGYFCRKCLGGPIYESQLRNRKARAYLRAYRLRERLGGSRPVVDPIPGTPIPDVASYL